MTGMVFSSLYLFSLQEMKTIWNFKDIRSVITVLRPPLTLAIFVYKKKSMLTSFAKIRQTVKLLFQVFALIK